MSAERTGAEARVEIEALLTTASLAVDADDRGEMIKDLEAAALLTDEADLLAEIEVALAELEDWE